MCVAKVNMAIRSSWQELRTGIHPHQHRPSDLRIGKEVVVDNCFIPLTVNLLLEEDKEVEVIALISKGLDKLLLVLEAFSVTWVTLHRRSLVRFVAIEVSLDLLGRGTQRVKSQEMVSDVIVKAFTVEEDVVIVVVFLEELGGPRSCSLRDLGDVVDTCMVQRELDLRRCSHGGG